MSDNDKNGAEDVGERIEEEEETSNILRESTDGRDWLQKSNCANKILWGQYEFLKHR